MLDCIELQEGSERFFSLIGPTEEQKVAKTGQMVVFGNDGEEVQVASALADTSTNTTNISSLDILLIGGVH